MAAIATVTLMDGQATPVAHTFTPVGVKNAVAVWKDKSVGIPIGFSTLTYSLREPSGSLPAYKLSAKLVVPTLEVTSPSTATGIQPAPTKAYDCLLNIDAVIPDRATDQNRKDLYAYGVSLLANAILSNGIKNAEAIWG